MRNVHGFLLVNILNIRLEVMMNKYMYRKAG